MPTKQLDFLERCLELFGNKSKVAVALNEIAMVRRSTTYLSYARGRPSKLVESAMKLVLKMSPKRIKEIRETDRRRRKNV